MYNIIHILTSLWHTSQNTSTELLPFLRLCSSFEWTKLPRALFYTLYTIVFMKAQKCFKSFTFKYTFVTTYQIQRVNINVVLHWSLLVPWQCITPALIILNATYPCNRHQFNTNKNVCQISYTMHAKVPPHGCCHVQNFAYRLHEKSFYLDHPKHHTPTSALNAQEFFAFTLLSVQVVMSNHYTIHIKVPQHSCCHTDDLLWLNEKIFHSNHPVCLLHPDLNCYKLATICLIHHFKAPNSKYIQE